MIATLLAVLKSRVTPYVALAALLVAAFAAYTAQQRAIGRAEASAAQAAQALAHATHRADSLSRAYRADTVRLTRLVARWDTLYAPYTDTLTVRRTDTVRVPVRVLVAADSTIRVCRDALLNCDQRVAAAQAIAAGWEARLLTVQAQQPSALSVWGSRLGALVAGLAIGRLVH
jgi:hypothetical protein